MKEITLQELGAQYTGTYSIKADTVRGREEKSYYELKVGDEVLIDNHFVLIVEPQEEKADAILEAIKDMDDTEIVSLWNEYCYTTNKYDDKILDAYAIEEWINNCDDKMSLLNRFYFGSDDFNREGSANPNRNFFTFNGYGNVISFDYIYNSYSNEFNYIDIDDLVSYIIDNDDDLNHSDIRHILDGDNE